VTTRPGTTWWPTSSSTRPAVLRLPTPPAWDTLAPFKTWRIPATGWTTTSNWLSLPTRTRPSAISWWGATATVPAIRAWTGNPTITPSPSSVTAARARRPSPRTTPSPTPPTPTPTAPTASRTRYQMRRTTPTWPR